MELDPFLERINRVKTDPAHLAFAEAMALDPSEVEVWAKGGWEPLHRRPDYPTGDWVLSFLRQAKFRRRARPKRSRVQEMAEAHMSDDPRAALLIDGTFQAWGEQVIRAVCEHLPGAIMENRKQECELTVVGLVLRHFLDPR